MSIDWDDYRATPPKLIGKTKKEVMAFLKSKQYTYGIACEDGKSHILAAIAQITLNIKKGIVVGTSLDNDDYGDWK